MLAEFAKKTRFPVEHGLLLAFCLFLPLVEFWKNVALLGYFAAWTVNRARARDFGGRWGIADTLVALWIGAAYLCAWFAGLGGHAWAKTGDLAVSALLFWMVMRAGYGQREMRGLLGALVASTLAGLALGHWRLWSGAGASGTLQLYSVGHWRLWSGAGASGTLQLYSVGHVNHTAIYIAIMLGVCASWLFARWRAWPANRRMVALAITVLVLVSLVVTASRAAVGVGFALLLALALAWWPRWRAPLAGAAVAVALGAVLLVGFGAEVLRKQMDNAAAHNVLSFRDSIWRMGLVGWEKYPWFGVGKDNYWEITPERVRAWRAEAGKDYDESRYMHFPHAHNLFINTLVERGVVGLASLLAILFASLAALVRRRPPPGAGDFAWLAWGAAASAWFVTVGVGPVNTTLHHEHGMLAALLLALWLSSLATPTTRAS